MEVEGEEGEEGEEVEGKLMPIVDAIAFLQDPNAEAFQKYIAMNQL